MRKGALSVAMVLLILLQIGNTVEIFALEEENNIILKQQNQDEENSISLDILLIGNSYTSSNTLNQKVERILDDSGINSDVEAVTGGGMKLSDHADDADQQGNELNTKLSERYDYVVLQDQSQVPAFATDSDFWIESNNAVEDLNERII